MREFAKRRVRRTASERQSRRLGLRRARLGFAVQARLVVGRSDDRFEREADLIADRVVAAVGDQRAAVVDDRGSAGAAAGVRRHSVVGAGGGDVTRDAESRIQRGSQLGAGGGVVDRDTESRIRLAQAAGHRLLGRSISVRVCIRRRPRPDPSSHGPTGDRTERTRRCVSVHGGLARVLPARSA